MHGGRVLGGRPAGAACAVAVVSVLATGCGSDSADESSTPVSAPSGELTARQYVQLERLHRSQIDRKESNEASIRRTIRACRRMDTNDELLAAVVDGCERSMKALASLMKRDCTTQEQCIALMSDSATLIDDLLATLDENAPVIERHVSDQACRDVLLSREQVAALDELSEAFKDFVEIVEGGDPDQIATAQADMQQASAGLDEAPSGREMYGRFKQACRPQAG